jgi:transcriptional regulator with XRE-family HTH domain
VAKKENRTYSRYTDEALKLLAGRIKATRLERSITIQDLAERAGVSRDLLYRIELADPACGIGVVFEIAALLGLTLFQSDYDDLIVKNKMVEDKLALLPSRARPTKVEVDDDF